MAYVPIYSCMQAIGCQTFYDTLFKHWGCRLRPSQELVELVEDSDEEEEKEVQSLGLALQKALGVLMLAPLVDLTVEPVDEQHVKKEPCEATIDMSTVPRVKTELEASEAVDSVSTNAEAAQPVKQEIVTRKKQWEDASMDAVSKRIFEIQSPGSSAS